MTVLLETKGQYILKILVLQPDPIGGITLKPKNNPEYQVKIIRNENVIKTKVGKVTLHFKKVYFILMYMFS